MKENRVLKNCFSAHKRVLIKIIPHHRESIYKFELSHVHLAVATACTLILLCAFLFDHIAAVRAAEVQVDRLQAVTAAQQHELTTFSLQTRQMWQRLQHLQKQNREIQQLTASSVSNLGKRGQAAVKRLPSAAAHAGSDTMSAIIKPNLWSRFTAWIGQSGGGRITFAAEAAQLTVLSVEMNEALAESDVLRAQAAAAAEARLAAALAHQRMLDAIPSIWPTNGYVTSCFCYRSYPDVGFHNGLDIVNDWGASVYATGAGIVTEADYDGGWGYKIIIDHGNGFVTWYAHNSAILVSAGQAVRKGQLIARVGATGFATGPHVHYSMQLYGRLIDPTPYLSDDPERIASMMIASR